MPTLATSSPAMGKQASCMRSCLGACCLPGAMLPVYRYGSKTKPKTKRVRSFGELHKLLDMEVAKELAIEGVLDGSDSSSDSFPSECLSMFGNLLLTQWEKCGEMGLYRYDVTQCKTKVITGDYGFVAQLNEGRYSKKRMTEFRVDQVLQDFDPKKFNFRKVGQEEVLFGFQESDDDKASYLESGPRLNSPSLILINVSPIEYGHVLLVPRIADCIPQRLSSNTFLEALNIAVEADNPFFRVGYNSLGAFATVNHLHFQAYYLMKPFAVERAPTMQIATGGHDDSLAVHELRDYPVRGLVLELGDSLEELARVVAGTAQQLQDRNIPFNIFISDKGARVFLYPQCFAERQANNLVPKDLLEMQVNPAIWEISGHIVLKRREDYEDITEDQTWRLLAEVSLDEEQFEEVKAICQKELESLLYRTK